MTSKREDREALIEEAAKAIFSEEQCDRYQSRDAASVDENWNGRLDDGDKAEYRSLARAALAVFEQAHTPTNDEREAVEAINKALTRHMPGAATEKTLYDAAVLARRALLRRPVQGEPSRPLTPCGNIACTGCRECGCPALGIEPQGEPTDAQVTAAIHALYAVQHPYSAPGELADYGDEVVTAVRAALRAAAAVTEQGGENRG